MRRRDAEGETQEEDEVKLRLYDWGPSPFCLKIRAILEYKSLEYERVPLLRGGLGTLRDLRRRGRVGKVPALDMDGEMIVDSTDIAEAIERLAPSPSIFPKDARDRALGHAIEEWADESLYFVGLYWQWVDPRGAAMVPDAFGKSLVGQAAYRFYRRRVTSQVAAQGTGRKSEAHIARDLERHLDAASELVRDRAFVLGDAPMLADFALMSQLVYLSRTPVAGPRIAARAEVVAYLERFKSLRRRGT